MNSNLIKIVIKTYILKLTILTFYSIIKYTNNNLLTVRTV